MHFRSLAIVHGLLSAKPQDEYDFFTAIHRFCPVIKKLSIRNPSHTSMQLVRVKMILTTTNFCRKKSFTGSQPKSSTSTEERTFSYSLPEYIDLKMSDHVVTPGETVLEKWGFRVKWILRKWLSLPFRECFCFYFKEKFGLMAKTVSYDSKSVISGIRSIIIDFSIVTYKISKQ